MKNLRKRCIVMLSYIHRICPLCVLSRVFPRSWFAKAMAGWGKICPGCRVYYYAKQKNFI